MPPAVHAQALPGKFQRLFPGRRFVVVSNREAYEPSIDERMRSIHDWLAETFQLWAAAAAGDAVPLSYADQWT